MADGVAYFIANNPKLLILVSLNYTDDSDVECE